MGGRPEREWWGMAGPEGAARRKGQGRERRKRLVGLVRMDRVPLVNCVELQMR